MSFSRYLRKIFFAQWTVSRNKIQLSLKLDGFEPCKHRLSRSNNQYYNFVIIGSNAQSLSYHEVILLSSEDIRPVIFPGKNHLRQVNKRLATFSTNE